MSLIQPLVQTPVAEPDNQLLAPIVAPLGEPVFLDVTPVAPAAAQSAMVDPIFGDSVFQEALVFTYVITESMGVTDANERLSTMARSVVDNAGADDSDTGIDSADAYARTMADSEGLGDVLAPAAGSNRAVTDLLGATDDHLKTVGKGLVDGMGLTDSHGYLWEQTRVPEDPMGLSDSVRQVLSSERRLVERANLHDPQTKRAWVYEISRHAATSDPVTPEAVAHLLRNGVQARRSTFNLRPTVAELQAEGITLLVISAGYWGLDVPDLTLAYDAYQAGISVVTHGNDTQWSTGNPIWTGSASVTRGLLDPVAPAGAHPVAQGWAAYLDGDAAIYPTGVRASAEVVGHFTMDGTATHAAIIAEQNPSGNGARYVHIQPTGNPAALWDAVVGWVDNTTSSLSFSTYTQSFAEGMGVLDSNIKSLQRELTESVGSTDTPVSGSTFGRTALDGMGVTSTPADTDEQVRIWIDPLGLLDSLAYRLIPPGRIRYGKLRPVRSGAGYVWSIYGKRQTVDTQKLFLEVRYFDAAMVLLGKADLVAQPATDDPSRYVLRVVTPSTCVHVGLYMGIADAPAGAKTRWDGAQWELGDVETAYGPKPDEILPGAVQSTMLALGAVTTDRVATGAITNSLIAIGAITAGSIASGAVGSPALATDAVDNRVLADGSVNSSQLVVGSVIAGAIAAGAVITEKLAANAVTAGTIAAGAVTADKIGAGQVVAGKIAADAIGANQIAAGAVVAGKIAADAVTANEIAANSVTANEIVAGSITSALIAGSAITGGHIAGNTISGGHIQGSTISGGHIAADTITAGNIAADAIGTSELAANAVIAENIVAGNVLAGHVAAGAVTTDKLSANAVIAEKISAGAILADKIATNAVTAGKINAGAVVSDSITSDAILGKTLQGGTLRTNGTNTDRVEIVGASSLYDAVRWYAGFANGQSNYLAGEIRGYMGDIGAYGLLLNSHTQLGSTQSILYQVGKRKTRGSMTSVIRVRAGTVVGNVSGGVGGFQWEGGAAFDTVPSFVIATAASRAVMLRVYDISTTGAKFEALVPGPSGGAVSIGDGGLTIHYYAEVTV